MRFFHFLRGVVAAALLVLTACGTSALVPHAPEPDLPVARWDHQPHGAEWTVAALEALDGPAAGLVAEVPADIATWCPGYDSATEDERKAFWVGLVSTLAKHESTWRSTVSGGGGRWHGLLQISPATARSYGCVAGDAKALKNGDLNLRCGLRIMASTVPRDGVIAAGGKGVAADWGPFHQPSKRADMAAWTRAQSYCQR